MPEAGLQITILEATEDDVDDIHALVVELAVATGMQHRVRSSREDFLRHGFSNPPAFQALIARQAEQAVGMCLYFYEFSTWLGRLGVYIQDLVVSEAARGNGLGQRLVAETVRSGQERGATHLRLSVDQHNDAAIRFYRHIGMDASADERIFHAHGSAFRRLADLT